MSVVIPDPATTKWVPLAYGASIQSNVPSARVYTTAVQSLATGTWTALIFDGERWDTDNIHDNVTNNTRLTCRTAGKYLVTFSAAFAPNATGTRGFCFRVNNTTLQGVVLIQAVSVAGREHYGNANIVLDLVVGDFVECLVYQESGAALNTSISVGQDAEIISLGPGLLGRGIQNLTGTYLNRPAANTVSAGTTYYATDTMGTFLSDGFTWLLVNQRAPIIIPATMSAAPFTTPYDGQEIILVDSVTNPTYQWRFRYNVNDTTAYKWEYIGGNPFTREVAAQVTVGSVWPTLGIGSGGPSFDVPRAGNYQCNYGCNAVNTSTASAPMIGLTVQATQVDQGICYAAPPAANLAVALSKTSAVAGLAATNTIAMIYGVLATGAGGFDRRWLTVTPIKIA